MLNKINKRCVKYVICIFFGLFLGTFLNCSPECTPKIITIEVPAKKGSFDIVPTEKEIVYKDSIVYRDKIVTLDKPVDKNKYIDYVEATEEEKEDKYVEAIKQREYEDTIENEDIIFTYKAKVTGTLDNFNISYERKSFNLDVAIEEPKKYKLYYGGGATVPLYVGEGVHAKGGFIIKNKKDNLYQIEVSSDRKVSLGVYFQF